MKKIFLIGVIVLCSFKTAQVKTFSFAFTINETETILKALSKLPYEESAPLINKIQVSAQRQMVDTTKTKK